MLDGAGPYLFYHICKNRINSDTRITLLPLTYAVMNFGIWSVRKRSCMTCIQNSVGFMSLKFLYALY